MECWGWGVGVRLLLVRDDVRFSSDVICLFFVTMVSCRFLSV
jgi:hypothetical protein